MFTDKDLQKFNKINISQSAVTEQLERFKTGFPFLKIKSAANTARGIFVLSESEQEKFEKIYDNFTGSKLKFVPASGAASRMFKALFEAKEMLENGANIDELKSKNSIAKTFFENIENFAFYDELMQNKPLSNLEILQLLLTPKGLNYGNLPKGVLLFHKYSDFKRTPVEEHLVEAAKYSANKKTKKSNLHFTISSEHLELFQKLLDKKLVESYSAKHDVNYNIVFSTQNQATNTIAVNENNEPFRTDDGELLFYPSGHGALLRNLNYIDSDIVFIKNIDNVVPETKVEETVKWKKIIAGILVDYKEKISTYINNLQENDTAETRNEIIDFFSKKLCIDLPQNADKELLFAKLNRPVRVCGMVKNEGEPGGGPFIIIENDGATSLQILESSQIDKNDKNAMAMLASSTHFNPVDLVCSFKNYKGEKFDLMGFRDDSTGFISEKSRAGKTIKVQELPGLWNGAMSNWNTVFVEVPIETFNPVKTVIDLLRKEHQC
jgi:hypothetical protein